MRAIRDTRGSSTVEMGVALAGIIVVVIIAVVPLGKAVKNALHMTHGAHSGGLVASTFKPATEVEEPESDNSLALPLVLVLPLVAVAYAVQRLRRKSPIATLSPIDETPPEYISTNTASHHARLFEKRQEIYRILSKDILSLIEGRMEVRQLMSTHVRTVAASVPAGDIRTLLKSHDVRHLLVCAPSGELMGVVSDRDLRKTEKLLVSDVMSRTIHTVRPDTLINPAVTSMLDHHISSMPVVEDGKPVGILTTTDLVMALQCALQLMAKAASDSGVSHRPQS